MTKEQAETLALQALSYIIGNTTLCVRFLDLTGLQPSDFNTRMTDSDFLGAILDFLLGHEPDLIEFCAGLSIDPQNPARASALLSGPASHHWS